jgi:hypothetical protein
MKFLEIYEWLLTDCKNLINETSLMGKETFTGKILPCYWDNFSIEDVKILNSCFASIMYIMDNYKYDNIKSESEYCKLAIRDIEEYYRFYYWILSDEKNSVLMGNFDEKIYNLILSGYWDIVNYAIRHGIITGYKLKSLNQNLKIAPLNMVEVLQPYHPI